MTGETKDRDTGEIRRRYAPLGTVLTVEDDDDARRLIRQILEDAGYRVREATRVDEAVAVAAAERVDLVLLDFSLPGGSGEGFLDRPSAGAPGPRVIAVTACGDLERIVERMNRGLSDYLVKPFTRAQLIEKVDAALGVNRAALLGAIRAQRAGAAAPKAAE